MTRDSTSPLRHILRALIAFVAVALASPVAAQEQPPPAVVVERIEVLPVTDPEEFTATVEAIDSVDIRARVQGFLQTIGFEAGANVAAGDVIFEIEPAQYEAAVASARAQVARAEAERVRAERQLARARELFARDVTAQVTLDGAEAGFAIAAADVEVAKAALANVELDLSYTRIESPIAGQIGRSAFSQGNLVGPESGALARIVEFDPVRVVFSISERLLVDLRQLEAAGAAIPAEAVRFTLRLPNGSDYAETGRAEYVANEVDPQTGTIAVRVIFPNPDRLLVPGQFVTLVLREEEVPDLPVVPQTAVLQDRQGRFVYVLGEDNTVTQKRIETGARVGNGWAVTSGLSGGEPVVVQGIQRLADGMTVQPSQGQPLGTGE